MFLAKEYLIEFYVLLSQLYDFPKAFICPSRQTTPGNGDEIKPSRFQTLLFASEVLPFQYFSEIACKYPRPNGGFNISFFHNYILFIFLSCFSFPYFTFVYIIPYLGHVMSLHLENVPVYTHRKFS